MNKVLQDKKSVRNNSEEVVKHWWMVFISCTINKIHRTLKLSSISYYYVFIFHPTNYDQILRSFLINLSCRPNSSNWRNVVIYYVKKICQQTQWLSVYSQISIKCNKKEWLFHEFLVDSTPLRSQNEDHFTSSKKCNLFEETAVEGTSGPKNFIVRNLIINVVSPQYSIKLYDWTLFKL